MITVDTNANENGSSRFKVIIEANLGNTKDSGIHVEDLNGVSRIPLF